MPRPAMDGAEIAEKKEGILDVAAEIIREEGYANLSMRKIGARLGMTAANIYNYYANKDEINIAIRTRAGKILYGLLESAYNQGKDVAERIRNMAEAYIEFGLQRSNYYAIMFDMPTPKYADYVGTPLEKLAEEEKKSSEKSILLMEKCTCDFLEEGYRMPDNQAMFMIIIWSQLHGLISLFNSRLLFEVNPAPDKTVKEAAQLASKIFFSFIERDGE